MKHPRILTGLIPVLLVPQLVSGASFTVTGNDTTAKTLNTGETGTVTASGDLNVGGGTTTVTISGGTVSINNAGLIRATGTARAIDANAAGTALTITNSGTISSVGTNETIRMAQTATLTLTNQLGAFITSNAADAIRPGNNSIITNFGTISANPPNVASPAGSDGIDLRTQRTGITIHNSGTISGRHGIATDGANVGPSSVTVNNNAGGTIFALNGSGINVDGVGISATANVTNAFGATIKGGVFSAATDGDGDGIDVDGVLTLNNSGDVLGLGAKGANNPEGIAAGGGTITNTATGQIIGFSTAPNGDPSKIGSGILIDDSSGSNAVAATTVTNSGLIRGETGFGIKMIGTFGDTITNNATGTIRGAGASAGAAIQTGGGDDTITNKGTIIGDNGSAIALEAGNDTLNIQGNAAIITGDIDGGTGTNSLILGLGANNTFTYSTGTISNFNTVEVKSGTTVLDGAHRIAATSALEMTGGYLKISNAGGPNGQSFASLTLGDTSYIDLENTTSLTFDGLAAYTAGTLTILDYDENVSPNYAIRFLNNWTSDTDFLALLGATTVNGSAAEYQFDGQFTNVGLNFAPIPEPSTFGFGLVLLGVIGYHQRRVKVAA